MHTTETNSPKNFENQKQNEQAEAEKKVKETQLERADMEDLMADGLLGGAGALDVSYSTDNPKEEMDYDSIEDEFETGETKYFETGGPITMQYEATKNSDGTVTLLNIRTQREINSSMGEFIAFAKKHKLIYSAE